MPHPRPRVWLLLAIGAFGTARLPAQPVVTEIVGTFSTAQENGCLHVSLFYYRVDCSYENAHPTIAGAAIPWVGPTASAVYYRPDSPETELSYVPAANDARVAPTLRGTLAIDRAGTKSLDDDTVSGTLVVGPAARSLVTRTSADSKRLRAIETWSSLTHTLAPTRVSTAVPTPSGGVEYIVASRGFPSRLCRQADRADCFPSAAAALTSDGKWGAGLWAATSSAPVGRSAALGGNVGAQTTAVMADYRCRDNTNGGECSGGISVWGAAMEDPGLDNLLLRITSDAVGHVLTVTGYWTQEYRIGMGPPALQSPPDQDDSWLGGYLEAKGLR